MFVALGRRDEARPLALLASETFAPRLATSINLVVVTAVLLVQLINVSGVEVTSDGEMLGDGARIACFAGVAVLFVLQLFHSSRRVRPHSRWLILGTLSLQAVISYLPTVVLGEAWGGAAGFLLGSVLLLIEPAWVAFSIFAVFEVLTGYVAVVDGESASGVVYAVVANGLTGLVLYSVSKLADIVTDLHGARRELALRAVEEERQRFSRDLHDLLGYSLSAIALKGELAYVTIDSDPVDTKEQITSILSIARVALQDVRSVARSYRSISLRGQIWSARSVLTSAGIDGVTEHDDVLLSAPCETTLATVVREGVTNVIRHSKAEVCDIRRVAVDDTVTLSIVNDGVNDAQRTRFRQAGCTAVHGDGMGGLQNLCTRLGQVRGTLAVHIDDDGRFVLVATVPTRLTPGELV